MWQILKAEFRYNANILVPSYFIITFMSMIGSFLGVDPDSFSTVSWMVYIFAFAALANKVQKEKRERFYIGLPVTLAKIGVTRLLLLLIVYSSLSLLWLFTFFMEYSIFHEEKLWVFLASNFLVLNSLMFALICHDLRFYPVKKYRAIFLSSIALYFVLLMSLVIFIALAGTKEFASMFFSWPIFAICFIPTPISIYLIVVCFTKRTSFLDKGTCGCW